MEGTKTRTESVHMTWPRIKGDAAVATECPGCELLSQACQVELQDGSLAVPLVFSLPYFDKMPFF